MVFCDMCNVKALERLAEQISKLDESFDYNKWQSLSRKKQRQFIKKYVSSNYQNLDWEYIKYG